MQVPTAAGVMNALEADNFAAALAQIYAGTNNSCPPYVPSTVISDLRSGSQAEA